MKLSSLLSEISHLAKVNNLSEPFICGGVPRDKLLGHQIEFTDIDITTGNGSIHKLAEVVYKRLEPVGATIKILPDSHAQVRVKSLKLDFSSNFMSPKIVSTLSSYGIKNPTSIQCEMYSRDFTCNALLMDFNLTKIIDPLGQGIKDIENKFLRACLDPEITLGNDPRRIPRIFYMAAKLDFEVDPLILEWLLLNPNNINYCKPKYIQDKMLKAFEYNREKTSELLSQTRLWDKLPATPGLIPYLKTASSNVYIKRAELKNEDVEFIEITSAKLNHLNITRISENWSLITTLNYLIKENKIRKSYLESLDFTHQEQRNSHGYHIDQLTDERWFEEYNNQIFIKKQIFLEELKSFIEDQFFRIGEFFGYIFKVDFNLDSLNNLTDAEELDFKKLNSILAIIKNMNKIQVHDLPYFKTPKIISLFFENLIIYCDEMQKLLRVFNISLNKYINNIKDECRDYIQRFEVYIEHEKERKENKRQEIEKKELDAWAQNAISDAQLYGEYGNNNLTWDELDEEDKLALLERGKV